LAGRKKNVDSLYFDVAGVGRQFAGSSGGDRGQFQRRRYGQWFDQQLGRCAGSVEIGNGLALIGALPGGEIFVVSKKTSTIRPVRGQPPNDGDTMISESTKAVEKEGFQFPAAVSLPPKRRSRVCSVITFEDKKAEGSIVPIISPVRRRWKLKRSGRFALRWIDPKLFAAAAQAAPYFP
jgi:hypothetical protein